MSSYGMSLWPRQLSAPATNKLSPVSSQNIPRLRSMLDVAWQARQRQEDSNSDNYWGGDMYTCSQIQVSSQQGLLPPRPCTGATDTPSYVQRRSAETPHARVICHYPTISFKKHMHTAYYYMTTSSKTGGAVWLHLVAVGSWLILYLLLACHLLTHSHVWPIGPIRDCNFHMEPCTACGMKFVGQAS